MTTPPVALAIAGTDSGGAAGLAADLATFAALGVHGACVVSAITAQDTTGVRAVQHTGLTMLDRQLDAVLDDLPVAAVKAGMLGSAEAVRWLAGRVTGLGVPVVVDPVLRATSGAVLGDAAVVAAYRDHLLPVATVTTPNAPEARALLGLGPDEARPSDLAAALSALGPAVVVTGGPDGAEASAATCTDWLALPGREPVALHHPAVATTNDHGTGCTFSAALAALLAHRPPTHEPARLQEAVHRAADFTASRLALGRHWELGRGRGPVAHVQA